LAAVEQKLARTARLHVPLRAVLVGIHVHVVQPDFASLHLAESILKVRLAGPNRLDFRADERKTGVEGFLDGVLVPRLPIGDDRSLCVRIWFSGGSLFL